jgi:hypothetical protein
VLTNNATFFVDGLTFQIAYDDGAANQNVSVRIVGVPEPSSLFLCVSGLAALTLCERLRRRARKRFAMTQRLLTLSTACIRSAQQNLVVAAPKAFGSTFMPAFYAPISRVCETRSSDAPVKGAATERNGAATKEAVLLAAQSP